MAPDVEQFLSVVQTYVGSKGIYPPEKSTDAWTFVELFRPSIDMAIKRAVVYNERMRKYAKSIFGETDPGGPAEKLGGERSKVDRPPLKSRSELKRAILIQLTKQPKATDAEICRGLDADGAVKLPKNWKNKPGDYRFFDSYSDPRTRHRAEVAISKVRRELRQRGLLD